ncbi:glycosyltransferase [Sulfurimonas aquatica]|uniref:Glycosyltransferase n=1 Tax=Sulfurimonas aquatica TaxID=2672570 RepID=A0A975AZH5_9BACT|nr:glycosyltransferase [Sulfurimonas aquatica]QSZ41441.1 glycosyltransferase [Sulfurimonas aquatica]
MRLLIIANSTTVFGKELKNELEDIGEHVTLLDFESLKLFRDNFIEDMKYFNIFFKYKKIPKISMFFRMLYIRKLIKENDFDIINIHVSRWFYLLILPTLMKKKFIITFYGSDFYRTSNFIKNIQKVIYTKADRITFTNPITKQSFLDYYQEFYEKSYVCRFGLKTLDFIDKNRYKDRGEIKNILGYSQDKIIITCGYNATVAQQHEIIIKNLLKIDKKALNKIQFIFPLTYGDNSNKKRIRTILKDTNLDYIILEDFLYTDENAYIKLASDIMVNILKTDSFSGSMQEFLYAENIVITGSWLPYDIFDKEGIYYQKIDSENELSIKLENIINNIDEYKENLSINKNIIYKLSSWKNNINSWKDIYAN